MGKGQYLDLACVNDAKAGWNACEEEACTRRSTRITRAEIKRDNALVIATDTYFDCIENAPTEADQQHCYEIAQAAIDSAWAVYSNSIALADMIYTSEVLTCDFIYNDEVSECCYACAPWDTEPPE